MVGPILKLLGKPGIGNDVNAVDSLDGGQVVEHMVDHRLAGHRQQRLGAGQGHGMEAGRVARGQDDHFHIPGLL